jgi:hypothetical protein
VLLESVAKKLSVLNERVMFYLAAAVSDFYIPDEEVRVQYYKSPTEMRLCAFWVVHISLVALNFPAIRSQLRVLRFFSLTVRH